jgi:hypothetical protein
MCVKGLCTDESKGQPAQVGDGAAPGNGDQDGADGGDHSPGNGGDGDTEGDGDQGGDGADASHGPTPPPDAGLDPDVPVNADCPKASASLRFCDGFEEEFTAWTRDADKDTRLSIVTEAARGTHALEADTQKRGLWADVHASFAEIFREPLWARAYLWADASASYDAFTVLRVETASESSDASEGIDLSLEGREPRAVLYVKGHGREAELDDKHSFPLDAWTCVELELMPGALSSEGVANMYVDGRLAATLDTEMPTAGLERVRVGIFYPADEQGPVTVRVDAVAVSTERIGCD